MTQSDIDKSKLSDDLKEAFINFQWRQENPMPRSDETSEMITLHYLSDQLFHRKVDSMAFGIMDIVCKHIDK